MLRALRPPWARSQCLRRSPAITLPLRPFRALSTEAAAPRPLDGLKTPASHSSPDNNHDDALLRQIFDSRSTWEDFTSARTAMPTLGRTGLFRNPFLSQPGGFVNYAQFTLSKAQVIVQRVLDAKTTDEYKTIVRDLDRLSDLLCRVIDMADFVRVTHPSRATQREASEAWAMMYQYMNELNTTPGLNLQLRKAIANPEVTRHWNEEERTVAETLELDFSKSAVFLPEKARDNFVKLSQRISEIGSDFVDHAQPAQETVTLRGDQCFGIEPWVAKNYKSRGYGSDSISIPTVSGAAVAALRSLPNEGARRTVFCANRTASPSSVRNLEELVGLRADLARLAGFESYGHMALRDRMMAKSPESVNQFLLALSKHNAPVVEQELRDLASEKRAFTKSTDATIQPWDRDFYMSAIRRTMVSNARSDDHNLTEYFSIGTVMQGISRLFNRLYGIRFVPRETARGETWHSDVRRLDVISDTDGHVAVIYCDLFYRKGKSPNPAHFTIRCSREITASELTETEHQLAQAKSQNWPVPSYTSSASAANDGMATTPPTSSGSIYQLPTAALVCDFSLPQSGTFAASSRPALLTFHEVETLFHEMGHAMHSILARTSFQSVAGTRCATDLAELPSTLLEHFAADASVLRLFARHWDTDEALDAGLVAERLRKSRRFQGCDDENQIVLAMLDQALHSAPAGQSIDSTAVYHALQRGEHARMPPDPEGTAWQGFFGHLFGYGSTYYSYLFDRVLAERVWGVLFQGGKEGGGMSRDKGEHLKESLLRWGGSREPWRCLADTLKDERVAAGDESAMALVGSWGTGTGSSS